MNALVQKLLPYFSGLPIGVALQALATVEKILTQNTIVPQIVFESPEKPEVNPVDPS